MRKKIKAWAVLLKEIEDDPPFIDFVSKELEEAQKYRRENWDIDASEIVEVEISYSVHKKKE